MMWIIKKATVYRLRTSWKIYPIWNQLQWISVPWLVVDYDQAEPLDIKLKQLRLIEFYVEGPRFKDEEDCHKQSLEYLEETSLPNTEIKMQDLDVDIDDETWDLLTYKKHDENEILYAVERKAELISLYNLPHRQ